MSVPNRLGQILGNYELIELLGEGGFSSVYLSEHVDLHEQVAIKVVNMELTMENLEDFKAEARLVTRLVHPHIVRVLEFLFDKPSSVYYLIMDYAPYGTLRQRHSYGAIVPISSVLSYVKQVASALHYVHNKEFVHRDVKPDNMLIGRNQEILLSDFGAAIALQDQRSAAVIGTPEYMAPEQFKRQSSPASDQYSLGIVVYEWLCGTCPFTGATIEELARQHYLVSPGPLREKMPTISQEVEQVVMRALEKKPELRFKTIQEFADALELAYRLVPSTDITSLPIEAPPVVPPETEQVVGAPETEQVVLPPGTETVRVPKSETIQLPSNPASGTGTMVVPSGETVRLPIAHETKVISITPPPPTRKVSRLTRVITPAGKCLYTHYGHESLVRAVAWSPDGKRIASGSDDWTVQVWDAMSRANAFTYDKHEDQVWSVAWSPDSRRIASGSVDQVAHICNAATGQTMLTYKGQVGSAIKLGLTYSVAWSPDNHYVVSGGAGHTAHVWTTEAGQRVFTYRGHFNDITGLMWSPLADEHYVASSCRDNTVQVWNVLTGNTALEYRGHSRAVRAVAWSPDGKRLASAGEDATVRILDVATGKNTLTYRGHFKRLRTVAWSPDGKRLASAGDDRVIHVWDVATGDLLFKCEGHEGSVNAVTWSPDGQFLASASSDMTVKVWQAK